MLCEDCGKKEANIRYTKIINGVKKKYYLCENCSEKLGIANIDFNMPINFSSFFSNFLGEFETQDILSTLDITKPLKCENCDLTFEEFMNTGRIGCSNCYDTFQEKIDPILKNIQGSNCHVGRLGEIEKNENKIERKKEEKQQIEKIDLLKIKKEELKKAIQDERYEDAAKIRDEIKELYK